MGVTKWFIGVLLLLFSVALAQAGERYPLLEVQSGDVARIYNVRMEQRADDRWQLRGRVTRTLRDTKVPQGQIVTVVYNKKGKSLYTLTSDYKPGFVHRKKKRASYFTVRFPDKLDLKNSRIRIYYLGDGGGAKSTTSKRDYP
ncbi:hypothetical protein [Pontibacterium sp.]|uniref:hypothetical protein n=1 Tax=Pontibacterium sp. TaxID=2036026 RepID=UPI00356A9228